MVPGTIHFPSVWKAGVVAGVAFQRTGTRAGPGRGPTAWDSKDRQVPELCLYGSLDWTQLGSRLAKPIDILNGVTLNHVVIQQS